MIEFLISIIPHFRKKEVASRKRIIVGGDVGVIRDLGIISILESIKELIDRIDII